MKLLMIDPNPTYETNDTTWVFAVDEDDPDYLKLTDYLTRLSEAGVIDDWWTNEQVVTSASGVLETMADQYEERLAEKEEGYEDTRPSGGDDPSYRQQMNDAGRGALLR